MIAYLNGKLIEKRDAAAVIETQGVGYEVFCSMRTLDILGDVGSVCQVFVHTHYKADGAALFGFMSSTEKSLFLSLIKVDTVGPKKALDIMSAAPWDELVHLIEEGDIGGLSKLPKISKKIAELVVVKLKGKLSELLLLAQSTQTATPGAVARPSKTAQMRKLRGEAATALSHLGFRPQDVEKTLDDLNNEVWAGDLETVIRHALTGLSGNT